MSTTRTIFTTEEAHTHFGEYLTALRSMGMAKEYEGPEGEVYFGVMVEAALDTIEEFKANELEADNAK